jgi:hypothetical protein
LQTETGQGGSRISVSICMTGGGGYNSDMRVPVASEPPDNLGQLHGLSPKRAAAIPPVGASPTKKVLAKPPLTEQAKTARMRLTRILSNLGKGR